MNKLKSFFSGGINIKYESQNQNQTSHQSLTVDENATINDEMMHHPTIRHNNQTITGASTGIIDTNIPDQMRLTMLDVTPDDIQVISQLNDDHLRDQWGKISDDRICHSLILSQPEPIENYDATSCCCIGSVSFGDYQQYIGHHNRTCIQNITAYERVREYTINELDSIPILSNGDGAQSSSSSSSSFMQCDICCIIQIVSTLNHRRISIVGDSVQRQLFNGIECELFRRGFNISEWKTDNWEDEPGPNYTRWNYGIKTQHLFYCFSTILDVTKQ